MSITTWDEANDRLTLPSGKEVASRKVANHTYLQRRGPNIAVKFHDTDVVTFMWLNSVGVKLDTGGWLTDATMRRINEFTPAYIKVFTTKGRWMVAYQMSTKRFADGTWVGTPNYETAKPFKDGVRMTESLIGGYLRQDEVTAQDAHNRQVNKLLDKWLKGLTQGQIGKSQDIHYNHGAPCALCVTVPTPVGSPAGGLVGDEFEDTQHLLDHMIEGVYPWGLLCVAGRGHVSPTWVDMLKKDLRRFIRQRLYVGPVSLAHGRRPRYAPTWADSRKAS